MEDSRIAALFRIEKTQILTAPDGTPLHYTGSLILDGDTDTTHELEEILLERKLKKEK